jgi:hypothetical protein
VRYWINGEDEDYDREADHARRFGGSPPSSRSESLALVLVFGGEGLLILSVIVALIVSLR